MTADRAEQAAKRLETPHRGGGRNLTPVRGPQSRTGGAAAGRSLLSWHLSKTCACAARVAFGQRRGGCRLCNEMPGGFEIFSGFEPDRRIEAGICGGLWDDAGLPVQDRAGT